MVSNTPSKRSLLWKALPLTLVLCINVALVARIVWGEQSLYSWRMLKGKESALAQELSELDAQRASLSREIRLLKSDPAYVEKVIRQRLNYVRKNEILYLFDKSRKDDSAWTEKEAASAAVLSLLLSITSL